MFFLQKNIPETWKGWNARCPVERLKIPKKPFTRVSAFVRGWIVAAQWETHLGISVNSSDDIPFHSSSFGIMTAWWQKYLILPERNLATCSAQQTHRRSETRWNTIVAMMSTTGSIQNSVNSRIGSVKSWQKKHAMLVECKLENAF